jgi:hypothetical protein
MTTNDTKKRLSDIEDTLRKLMEKQENKLLSAAVCCLQSAVSKYLIPFILGMIIGNFGQPLSFVSTPQTTLEQQAALGGAAIPFPNSKPSPTLSVSPPNNSKTEPTPALWKSLSEPPLPPSPQADNGQTKSTKLSRPLLRRTE